MPGSSGRLVLVTKPILPVELCVGGPGHYRPHQNRSRHPELHQRWPGYHFRNEPDGLQLEHRSMLRPVLHFAGANQQRGRNNQQIRLQSDRKRQNLGHHRLESHPVPESVSLLHRSWISEPDHRELLLHEHWLYPHLFTKPVERIPLSDSSQQLSAGRRDQAFAHRAQPGHRHYPGPRHWPHKHLLRHWVPVRAERKRSYALPGKHLLLVRPSLLESRKKQLEIRRRILSVSGKPRLQLLLQRRMRLLFRRRFSRFRKSLRRFSSRRRVFLFPGTSCRFQHSQQEHVLIRPG